MNTVKNVGVAHCESDLPESIRGRYQAAVAEATSRPKKGRGPVVFLTLDDLTEASLQAFIEAQTVPPDRAPVCLTALRRFLTEQGFYPPKG